MTTDLQKEVEDFVGLGRKLDAKKRKHRITYSEINRDRLASKESRLLKKIAALVATLGAVGAAYALFHNRNDLRIGLQKITTAIGPKLDEAKQNLWQVWNDATPRKTVVLQKNASPRTAVSPEPKEFAFFKYIGKSVASSAKTRFQYAKNSYTKGSQRFVHRLKSLY